MCGGMRGAGIGEEDVGGEGGVGGGWYVLKAAGGSGGESKLFPVLKAVRLLGVASRITTFMDCLQRHGATKGPTHSGPMGPQRALVFCV